MAEIGGFAKDVMRAVVREVVSEEFDPKNYAMGKKGKSWVQYALSLPEYLLDDPPPSQNPDGSFPFMLGIDRLGESPLA